MTFLEQWWGLIVALFGFAGTFGVWALRLEGQVIANSTKLREMNEELRRELMRVEERIEKQRREDVSQRTHDSDQIKVQLAVVSEDVKKLLSAVGQINRSE